MGATKAGFQSCVQNASFVESGLQQINVRALGLVKTSQDIEKILIKTRSGTPIKMKDIATVTQGQRIRLGQIGKAIHRADGVVVDDNDVVEGIVFMRKGADTASTMDGIHIAVQKLNEIKSTAIYPKTAMLFIEGQQPRGVFVLCTGKAKLSTSSREGKTIITKVSEPGDVLGLNATISNCPYEVTAEMIEPGASGVFAA